MEKIINFEAARQEKERGIGCRGILQVELDTVANTESIVIVTLTKDNKVNVSYSSNSSLEALGMLDVAKTVLFDEMD